MTVVAAQRVAITRGVSDSIARCELTHIERQPIDVDLSELQKAEGAVTCCSLIVEVR